LFVGDDEGDEDADYVVEGGGEDVEAVLVAMPGFGPLRHD